MVKEAEGYIKFTSKDKKFCDIIHRVNDIRKRCDEQKRLYLENEKDFKKIFEDIDKVVCHDSVRGKK